MAQQQSLFGATPEELQLALTQQQQAADWNQANAYGNKDLSQQISTTAFMGGSGIGRGLQGLGQGLGYIPEDPRLAEAKKMMEIKQRVMQQGINPEDIDEVYPALIRELYNGGLVDKALQFQKEYATLSNQQDAIAARQQKAREAALEQRRPGLKIVRNLASSLKDNPGNAEFLALYEASISDEAPMGDLNILKDLTAFTKQTKATKDAKVGINEQGRAVYRDPDRGEYIMEMRQTADGYVPVKMFGNYNLRKEGGVNVNIDQNDLMKYRKQFLDEVKSYDDRLKSTGEAVTLFQQAYAGNPTAVQAFKNAVARAFRSDGNVAQAEVNRVINAGDLPTRVGNTIKSFLFGTVTDVSLEDARDALKALRDYARKQRSKATQQWTTSVLKGMSDEQISRVVGGAEGEDQDFDIPLTTPTTRNPTGTVSDIDLINKYKTPAPTRQ